MYIYSTTCYITLELNDKNTSEHCREGVSNTAAEGVMVNSTSFPLLSAVVRLSLVYLLCWKVMGRKDWSIFQC